MSHDTQSSSLFPATDDHFNSCTKERWVGIGGERGKARACMHAKLFILLVSVTVNQLRDAHFLQSAASAELGRNVFSGSTALPVHAPQHCNRTGNSKHSRSKCTSLCLSVSRNGICRLARILHHKGCLKTRTEGTLSYASGRRQKCSYRSCG